MDGRPVPFAQDCQLDTTRLDNTIPNTNVSLTDSLKFLKKETTFKERDTSLDLNHLHRWLWLAGLPAKYTRPLHQHKVLRRDIIITEQMRLHLTWIDDIVFLKPIPRALLNYQFFHDHVCSDEDIYSRVMGFLYTYLRSIRHESDFDIAVQHKLLPHTTWEKWLAFTRDFPEPPNQRQGTRWDFGELRIWRLNIIARVLYFRLLRGWITLTRDTGVYFTGFFALIAALFAVLSVTLSAFQVAMTPDWTASGVESAGYWVAIVCLICTASLALFAMTWFTALLLTNSVFAIKSFVKKTI
ncbi:hypothetical protein CPB86DRAFT_789290 [Serendipita vermifera]|nr:hypothetical protein CPB86DRAFT_789290 [Serendipita vermifera]